MAFMHPTKARRSLDHAPSFEVAYDLRLQKSSYQPQLYYITNYFHATSYRTDIQTMLYLMM